MKKILFLFFLIIIILIILGAVFGLAFNLGKEYQKTYQPATPEEVDFSLFWQVWNNIHEKFPDREKIDTQKLIQGAISGMIESLEDPNTVFFTPEETEGFLEGLKGEFEGIGIKIDIRNEQLQVIAPIKETPAYRAGLRAGDKIIKIDDISTVDMTIEKAVSRIRGPKGTEVVLTIYRQEWEEKREIKIKRDVIKIPTVSWEIIEKDIAHLKIYHFIERTENDFRQAANEILASQVEKIILDLRNNPGGYLHKAKDIAGWFLEREQVVVIQDFGERKEQKIYKSDGPSRLLKYPIIILINKGSASGSEILAGALRDNREIKIIGETSFGKGSVQEFIPLKEGASLKLTVANWLTPDGKLITNQGLKPDLIIEMTEKDIEQKKDPQLDKAIEILKKMR
jgi:carboxyl-terminal processing protease